VWPDFCDALRMRGIGQRFVYILRSEVDPERHYVGRTSDVENRIEWHNAGPSGQTVQDRPWSSVVIVEFRDESTAVRFEKYLKSGSGRAFAKRHFGPTKTATHTSAIEHSRGDPNGGC
jgi:putative endonuclease